MPRVRPLTHRGSARGCRPDEGARERGLRLVKKHRRRANLSVALHTG